MSCRQKRDLTSLPTQDPSGQPNRSVRFRPEIEILRSFELVYVREPDKLMGNETHPDFSNAEISTLRSNKFFTDSKRTVHAKCVTSATT